MVLGHGHKLVRLYASFVMETHPTLPASPRKIALCRLSGFPRRPQLRHASSGLKPLIDQIVSCQFPEPRTMSNRISLLPLQQNSCVNAYTLIILGSLSNS